MFQKVKMVEFEKYAQLLFNCKCSIFEYVEVVKDYVTKSNLSLVSENIPCRRSYSTGTNFNNYIKTGEQDKDYVAVKQYVKLFLPKETVVKVGSFVRVEYNGEYEYYEYSGHSLKYDTHIEILLKTVKRWA